MSETLVATVLTPETVHGYAWC